MRTEWIDRNGGPRVGARFTGLNPLDSMQWRVTCVVQECEPPRSFGWVVLDAAEASDRPSSRWRFELEPLDGGRTVVRETFEHGPGDSGLRRLIRAHPEIDAAAVVEHRREQLRRNMVHTITAIARVAEAG